MKVSLVSCSWWGYFYNDSEEHWTKCLIGVPETL